LISTPEDTPRFEALLKGGSQWGINIQYYVQKSPDGLAQAFILGESFIGNHHSTLVLGDNIFYGHDFHQLLLNAKNREEGATIFTYHVKDPERYGVAQFDGKNQVISLEEKPIQPKSNYAVTGLYFYDEEVVLIAKSLKPSARGELEITDVNRIYLERDQLKVSVLSRGTAWLDTGTFEGLHDASSYIKIVQERQNASVGNPSDVAVAQGWI
jgi:glucose-1-phosphate thymidylyltransferase